MVERGYKLQDVYDFLKEYYNLEWRNFLIIKDSHTIPIKMSDFKKSCLSIPAVLWHGETKEICWMTVSNRYFVVYGYGENNRNKSKTKLWIDFIAKRHNQEQGLQSDICKQVMLK
ncbi:MAG: hypothetical protein IJ371_04365 [Clostridia bacterium]|nr:hypothetical protein [Clostridia bacterium]